MILWFCIFQWTGCSCYRVSQTVETTLRQADVALWETACRKEETSEPQPQRGSALIGKWGFNVVYWIHSNQNIVLWFCSNWSWRKYCFLTFLNWEKKKKKCSVFLFLHSERKEGSKLGCRCPWKLQFCENHLFTGQPSQRESPASPTANISAQSLELIQRSFTPLDIFIVDLNKLWTRLFWQEHTESGNLKINPNLEPSAAFQQPWWYTGMSLSERRWWADLATSVARVSFAVCWHKQGRRYNSILQVQY